MAINVAKEVAMLRHMTVSELRDRYHEVFSEGHQRSPTNSGSLNASLGNYKPTQKETSPNARSATGSPDRDGDRHKNVAASSRE